MIGRSLYLTAFACLFAVSALAQTPAPVPGAATPDLPLLSQQAPTDLPPGLVPPPPPTQLPLPTPIQPPPTTPPAAEATPAPWQAAPANFPPPATQQTGFSLPSSALATTPAPSPMPSPLIPPPPPTLDGGSQSYFAPTNSGFPPAPVVPTISAPSQSPMNSGLQKIDARLAKRLKHLIRGLVSIRDLPDRPANDSALRLLLGAGTDVATILELAKFPVLPRFQARSDESVVRNRSYDSWEYRFFGAFQTRLNGWIKPQALEVRADLKFDGRRKSWVRVTAVVTRVGQMTGRFTVQGSDAWGRLWNFAVEMSSVQLHDDGLPSGGVIKLTGQDPLQKSMALALRFPCEVIGEKPAPHDKRKKENRVSR